MSLHPGLRTETDVKHYKRYKNDVNGEYQPKAYAEFIQENEAVSRSQFERWAKKQDYVPNGGSHNASLLMLERIGEIRRVERGNNEFYIWDGE